MKPFFFIFGVPVLLIILALVLGYEDRAAASFKFSKPDTVTCDEVCYLTPNGTRVCRTVCR